MSAMSIAMLMPKMLFRASFSLAENIICCAIRGFAPATAAATAAATTAATAAATAAATTAATTATGTAAVTGAAAAVGAAAPKPLGIWGQLAKVVKRSTDESTTVGRLLFDNKTGIIMMISRSKEGIDDYFSLLN